MARDLKEESDRWEGLFAATPPLETLKATLTLAHRDGLNVLAMDVKKAHLNGKDGPEDRHCYVQASPPESATQSNYGNKPAESAGGRLGAARSGRRDGRGHGSSGVLLLFGQTYKGSSTGRLFCNRRTAGHFRVKM